ncbi:putative senescence marker protein-30 (SMP-30) [Sinorhizobium meliloti CCNWSX0020]|uniref:Putative senescence marker protein-30 (SMP-30) n=1 Tax=Sinorhizobium meliloti CCNWSX0020 TaxID=1107881 RepID=H0G2F5_RHIML|nr:SMP-30/gluconolactonase/LRE family protein [Sinorhizobium meliloti]EHK76512.1 putative senescence marker protein-30 (SMP-30) [Sinorhizobium meliloti CCNWSX0020]
MGPRFECIVDCRNTLGECPLWSAEDQCLWWIDVADPRLWKFVPSSLEVSSWRLTKPPAALVLRPEGGLLVIFRKGFSVIDRLQPGDVIDQEHPLNLGEDRFNDGRVDAAGRIWIGSMDRKLVRPLGRLYSFSEGTLSPMDEGFALSNGIGWSPDWRTMYFAETQARSIYAYEFDLDRGAISNRRIFASTSGEGGPDGLCVDSDGNVWVAVFGGGRIERYSPSGEPLGPLELPNAHPTSCTFGGRELDTLFVTSSTMKIDGGSVGEQEFPGGLWSVRLPNVNGQLEAVLKDPAQARHHPEEYAV